MPFSNLITWNTLEELPNIDMFSTAKSISKDILWLRNLNIGKDEHVS